MKRILVVEDEQMLAKIIGMKLQDEQYEVQHAYDGQQAYEMLSQPDLPDLVLLDVLLPKMSGFDVLEKLRQENRTLPKIIIFSNFAQKADVERAQALGAIDYIVKAAFSPAEILSKIKSIFARTENEVPAPVPVPIVQPPAMAGSQYPVDVAPVEVLPAPENIPISPYSQFESMQDVMPMSDVLRPDVPNNNP